MKTDYGKPVAVGCNHLQTEWGEEISKTKSGKKGQLMKAIEVIVGGKLDS